MTEGSSEDILVTGKQQGERFFQLWMGFLFLTVLLAFPIHALVNPDKLPPMRPILHIHALTMGSWYALAVLQVSLIGTGRALLHRKVGKFSLALAAVMLTTGITISLQNYERSGDNFIALFNSTASALFVIMTALALYYRKRPVWHKRYMAIAALALMGPAFGRVEHIIEDDWLQAPMLFFGLMAILVLYDLIKYRKVFLATAIGIGLLLSVNMIMVNIYYG